MKLTLAPIPYLWPRDEVFAFYQAAADWPVDVIYLGETICSKRRELKPRDWLALATMLASSGREVVISTLALLEAESELATLRRLIEEAPCRVEANDMSAVQLLRERQMPFIGGPTLNVYNAATVRLLCEDGMQRLVLGVEQGREMMEELHATDMKLPEIEVQVWGRLALAYSARCFTARAHDLTKDDCGFRCKENPEGLSLTTQDGAAFLALNGIQVQGEAIHDLGPELCSLRESGVDLARIQPQPSGTAQVVQRFRHAIDANLAAARHGTINGYWHGGRGSALVELS